MCNFSSKECKKSLKKLQQTHTNQSAAIERTFSVIKLIIIMIKWFKTRHKYTHTKLQMTQFQIRWNLNWKKKSF